MNKNPESKTAAEDLSNCINPKLKVKAKSKKELELERYWKRQREIEKEIFRE